MNELETQVAKIQIGNQKQATTHVLIMSEEAANGEAELFVVTELPMFNPAAFGDCEQIAQAVAATLKRSYRKEVTDSSFESALAHINEELGKLASIGKTHWIGKLNALVAVKYKQHLNLATTGKTSALLFREGKFATISENSKATHPLKTFENFSVGKLKLNDIVILSTSQLLNHISVDRLKNIIQDNTLQMAAEHVIKILEDNAGPDVAFGTLIAQLVEAGADWDEQIEFEQYVAAPRVESKTFGEGAKQIAQGTLAKAKPLLQKAVGFTKQKISFLTAGMKTGKFTPSKNSLVTSMKSGMSKASRTFDRKKFQGYSKQRKFVLISAAVLLLALVGNIIFSSRYKKASEVSSAFDSEVPSLEQMLTEADGALVYRDERKTQELITTFNARVSTYAELSETQALKKTELENHSKEIIDRLEHKTTVQVVNVATLSPADFLIKLPGFIATQTAETIVSYNKTSGATEDNTVRANDTIAFSAAQSDALVAIHNGTSLAAWNPKTGKVDRYFSQSVPTKDQLAAMTFYATNNRVYTLNKSSGQVISFVLAERGFSNPVISVQNIPNAAGASDLAIDGSIYIYLNGEIIKFNAGKPAEFNQPILISSLSPRGKLATENGWNGLYVLDPDNNRILILNKTGEVIQSLVNDQFKNAKDFVVDEKSKTIFVLADSNLLKINF